MMRILLRHNLLRWGFLAALGVFAAFPAQGRSQSIAAEAGFLEEAAGELAAMINEARRDPLATAAGLGRNPETVLADLPELAGILTGGLAPLAVAESLGQAATRHAEDIFTTGDYSSESADGSGPAARMAAAGYDAGVAGETLGFLGFINYVAAHEAVQQMFAKMFLDELNPARTKPRVILNPDFSDLGVALASGRWQAGGVAYNAYVAVCDFGTTARRWKLLEMINRARQDPLGTAAGLGVDPRTLGTLQLQGGMGPVTLNSRLNEAAELHTADMFARNYYSTLSPGGNGDCIPGRRMPAPGGPWRPVFCLYDSPLNRIEKTGYGAADAAESLGILRIDGDVDEDEALELVFADMVASELAQGKRVILNPDFKEVGIGVGVGPFSPGLVDGEADAWLVTLDFAKASP